MINGIKEFIEIEIFGLQDLFDEIAPARRCDFQQFFREREIFLQNFIFRKAERESRLAERPFGECFRLCGGKPRSFVSQETISFSGTSPK